MNEANFLNDIFTPDLIQLTYWGFFFNLVLTAILSYLLGEIYIRYGMSLSNRKDFARNFLLLGLSTMLIITIVQSSLALSLGLIGALSIVRFRAAIKEPEELIYLFLTIAIGLGMGANQRFKTIIAFIVIYIIIWLTKKVSKKNHEKMGYLTLTSKNPDLWDLKKISDLIEERSDDFKLQRFDKMQNLLEAFFLVSISNTDNIQDIDKELRAKDSSIQIIFANTNENFK